MEEMPTSWEVGGSAFVPEPASIEVNPENATNRDLVVVTSSDRSVADCFQTQGTLTYEAFRKGTVIFTASVEDKDPVTGETTTVTGSTEKITYSYQNPVTEVTADSETVAVKENESCALPVTITGAASDEGWNVTEPSMTWEYSAPRSRRLNVPKMHMFGSGMRMLRTTICRWLFRIMSYTVRVKVQ